MASWCEGRKLMFIGRSGLQYRSVFQTPVPLAKTVEIVREFYSKRGAVLAPTAAQSKIIFTRGRKWISWFSWLLAASEKWPFQEISVSVVESGPSVAVSVEYNVRLFFTLIVAPNLIEMEARELASLLGKAGAA